MLSYAFTTLNQGGYEDVATEEFENMHNLFAAILAKGISRQLKQGLYREYLNRKEDVAVVRGKIDMPGTIQNRLSRRRVLTCEYDELSENNLLNQNLKTTVMLLLCHARVDQAYKSDLKKEMFIVFDVGSSRLPHRLNEVLAREAVGRAYVNAISLIRSTVYTRHNLCQIRSRLPRRARRWSTCPPSRLATWWRWPRRTRARAVWRQRILRGMVTSTWRSRLVMPTPSVPGSMTAPASLR